jgi:hypothetical protein
MLAAWVDRLLLVEQALRPQAQPLVLLDQLLLLVDLPLAAPLAAVEPILWPRPWIRLLVAQTH